MKFSVIPITVAAVALAGCGAERSMAPGSPAKQSSAPGESAGTMPEGMAVAAVAEADASRRGSGAVNPQAQRRIIRNGSMSVRVSKLEDAEKSVLRLAKEWGGFVESQTSNNLASTSAVLEIVLRIPVNRFDKGVDSIASLGVVTDKSITSEDVTEPIADMTARLRVMRIQEETYLTLLKQAKTMKDSLTVHDTLMRLRTEIEGLEAQLKSMSDQADFSTLALTLIGPTTPTDPQQRKGWAEEAFISSTNSLNGTLQGMGQLAIGLVVMSPIWLPPLLVAGWFIRRAKKNRTSDPSAT